MSVNHIDAYLAVLRKREEGKWGFVFDPEGAYWRVEYRGFAPPCKFYIELASGTLLLHAKLGFEIWPHCHLALYRFALRLNEEMVGAKLGLSHAGEVSLMVESPLGDEGFASFSAAVKTLLEYYDRYYQELVLVAQDRKLAELVTATERDRVRREKELGIEVLVDEKRLGRQAQQRIE